jgi:hypothetical protein
VVLAVLLSVAALTATAGWAGGWSATAAGSTSVSTGRWALVATQATGTPGTGALALTYLVPVVGGPPPQYFDLVNTGSSPLTGATYGVGVAGGGLLSATTVTLTACVGARWNTTFNTCAGTKRVLGTWSASSSAPIASSVVAASPGDRLNVQASVGGSGIVGGFIKATISLKVSAGQPRQIPVAGGRLV